MKRFLLFLLLCFFTAIPTFADESNILPSVKGCVKAVEYFDMDEGEILQTKQIAEVKLISGDNKGEIIYLDNVLTGNPYYDIKLKKGLKVILHTEMINDELQYSIEDVHRSNALILLALLFGGLLLYVGKKKGLLSLISIGITCLLISSILVPIILFGINPILGTVLVCLLSTAITIYLVGGFNRKSTSAIIGCVSSLICAGILSFITVKIAGLTGFAGENMMFLYSAHPQLNFISITISCMMLATLGAVMDVGMSIASTINEIYTVDNTKTVKELFISGMNVGRDIIGTMANTLILVYMGGALPLLLLSSNIDMLKFLNLNQVVTEIASALIGSCAIIICVPLTALVASAFVPHKSEDFDLNQLHF